MVGKGRVKAVVGEWDKDMGKTQTVEERKRGRETKDVRVAKKERRKVMVEGGGEGEVEGGVEEGGGGEQDSWFYKGDFNSHYLIYITSKGSFRDTQRHKN